LDGFVTTTQEMSLSAADRCDRCGAQAYIRAVLESGELLFCAHHGRAVMPTLKSVALSVDDQSDRLSSSPS
jgi:hypothetical protein